MAVTVSGGPSARHLSTPAKRSANFDPDSDDETLQPSPTSRTLPHDFADSKHHYVNGNGAGSSKRVKSSPGGKSEKAEDKQRRRKRAEELFKTRQELPFYQARKGILEEIMAHDTTIIIGETGCGKSTQLPQLLRSHTIPREYYNPDTPDAPPYKRGPFIAITQPRRLPTISLATRVAEEMGASLGGEVGYTVRFEDATGRGTRVKYLTEGVLMRELANGDRPQQQSFLPNGHGQSQADPVAESSTSGQTKLNLLLKYDIIIIDEAHERTLNTDFLCGTLKEVQRRRKELAKAHKKHDQQVNGDNKGKSKAEETVNELKIVIMSATLDPGKFKNFFETGRDVLLVRGRMFNVATRHLMSAVDDIVEGAIKQTVAIHGTDNAEGDVLVFMPGSDEIERCCERLRRISDELPEGVDKLQILPLYATLPPAAQAKIFAPTPPNTRRVIVATNIAETSITIPGVSYVVDTGFKKEKRFIPGAKGAIEHLARQPISQAAAWQRTGRAGRERAGECFRLYTKPALDSLPPFDTPEIQRCNLASAALQLIAMGINPTTFAFIDNPGREPILAAVQTLAGLGAITGPTTITPLGRALLFYPLDPPHARILLASFELGCPLEVVDILSLLNANGQVWVDKVSERDAIQVARAKFLHREGDHLTALNVFRAYLAVKEQNTHFGKWSRENCVNPRTLANAVKIRDQLRDLAQRDGRKWDVSCGSDTSLVTKSLLQGLPANTAVIQPNGTYKQYMGTLEVKIHPSSVLMSKKVPAILFDELVFTSAIYARNVSIIEEQWLGETPWGCHMSRA